MGLRTKAGEGEGTIPGDGTGGDYSLGGRMAEDSIRGD
jgi:hypothetical protein